mmetsp:Transcript_16333/g.34023  ORF Transcript_16333/g.34023 Transcript_16333/m.34023 type:complete len:160 (-) Transcript_16333:347-826(-)
MSDSENDEPRPGASPVSGIGSTPRAQTSDERVKSDEAALRRVANTGGVGAFAVAQPAAGGRRGGPRIRRSASARRRARERAGLEPASGVGGGEGGGGTEPQINPDDLIAADVEMQEMRVDEEVDDTLGFWQLDKTDKFICGGIVCLVIALIIILVLAMT